MLTVALSASKMDDLVEFERAIAQALKNCGSSTYSVAEFRHDFRECRDEILADDLAHGEDIARAFVHFMISDGIAVFAFFDDPFDVFVFPCVVQTLIDSAGRLAMVEVEAHRAILRDSYGKCEPDATVSRSAAELWLGQG